MKKKSMSRKKRQTTKRLPRFLALFLLVTGCFSLILAGSLIKSKVFVASAQTEDDRPKSRPDNNDIKGISPEAANQIERLQREKESRTPAQKKIDSQLLYKAKLMRGAPEVDDLPLLETGVEVDDKGYVAVDISAQVTKGVLRVLKGMKAEIISSFPQYHSITAKIPIDKVESLAELEDVIFIQPKLEATTNREDPPPVREESGIFFSGSAVKSSPPVVRLNPLDSFEERAQKVRGYLSEAISKRKLMAMTGNAVSEGVKTHRAGSGGTLYGVDGTGIKIGVLSDGVNSLAARQATGDLPAVTIIPGQAGGGDEGTAMLEIIHDTAPGAQLYFATAFNGIVSFANNIRALRTAGCDIIVDDVSYFSETPFQNGQALSVISPSNAGVVVQAVQDVTVGSQAGALYFSSAGNSGNKNDATSGAWEGDFADGGATAAPIATGNRLHDFGGGTTSNLINVAGTGQLYLKWSDPLGGSGNDYDLYVLNNAGTSVLASSTNIQDGNDDPAEFVAAASQVANRRIVIVKKAAAAARFLHLNTNRGRLANSTSGVVYGHNASMNTISVAAVPAGPAQSNASVGPFPKAHSAINTVEQFSSDGPRRIFYQADGTLITPGNVSATGGQVLQKPDITAADGVTTTTPGFIPFFGTSAAAPHAGALMALMKQASPSSTNTQLYSAMTSTAIDIEAPGVDRDSGAGIFMPIQAISALGVSGPAFFEADDFTAAEAPGNGNGRIEPGEGATLDVDLLNVGPTNATMVSATLTTTTPGITISNPNTRTYPDIAALNGIGTNTSPWRFTLASDFDCGGKIDFTLTVNFNNGESQTLNFTVDTDVVFSITSTLDTTAPPAGLGYTAVTGVQTTRMFRDGIASTCAAPKAVFPGTSAPGSRQYDGYTFTALDTGCVTVTMSGANAINLFVAAYNSGGYDPTNIASNYAADAGSSAASRTFSFNVTAGQTFTIVVYDVPILASPSGSVYTLNISGVTVVPCTSTNQVPIAVAQNVTVDADASCTAAVPASAVNNGSSDPDGAGDITSITLSPSGPFPIGMTNVILTVTDSQGAQSQASAVITVNNPAPTVGNYPTTTVAPGANTTVMPSAAPADANGTIASATVSAPGFTGMLTVNPTTGVVSVTGAAPPGSYTVTVTFTDNCGAMTQKTFTLNVHYQFAWFSYSGLLFNEQVLNQVTAGSNVPIRFTLNGYKGHPYSQPPTSQQISCSTFAPIGPATVINRFAPDPYYSSLYDFYQTTWQTQPTGWKFTCRQLNLYLTDGTTHSLKFYFK